MDKQIEMIKASDPDMLKQQLNLMVNMGWKIKGVVNGNPDIAGSESFVIMERDVADDPTIRESLYENEEPLADQYYTHPEPPRKEICISMG